MKPVSKDLTIAVDFIEILFAVILGLGFQEIMGRTWFKDSLSSFNARAGFEIFSFVLGYITVILSWYGYHRSIGERPIDLETKFGISRFLIDIFLLVLYWLLLVKSGSPWFMLLALGVIWALYFLWDLFEGLEHKERHLTNKVTIVCGIALWSLFGIFAWLDRDLSIGYLDWLFAILALATVIAYRWAKKGYG
ncbi:MAG: hypothetical protein ACE5Q6_01640 [Dehalococcoidia bacterium]